MIIAGFVYGCSGGTILISTEILVRDLLGPERLASAFGWIGIKAGVLRFAVGFFPGKRFEVTS